MAVSLRHPVRHLHPRQREALAGVPLDAVRPIVSRAHLTQNIGGGILSGAIWNVTQEYRSLAAHRGHAEALITLEARSRHDNHAAMAKCGASGCAACKRDAAR